MQCSDCSNLKWPVFLSRLPALDASSQSGKQTSSPRVFWLLLLGKPFHIKLLYFGKLMKNPEKNPQLGCEGRHSGSMQHIPFE